MNYPLSEKYGLKVHKDSVTRGHFGAEVYNFRAEEVEALLSSGVEVKGCLHKKVKTGDADNWAFDSHYSDNSTTHSALVVGIKPIEKEQPVSAEEVINEIESLLIALDKDYKGARDLINRLKATKELK